MSTPTTEDMKPEVVSPGTSETSNSWEPLITIRYDVSSSTHLPSGVILKPVLHLHVYPDIDVGDNKHICWQGKSLHGFSDIGCSEG